MPGSYCCGQGRPELILMQASDQPCRVRLRTARQPSAPNRVAPDIDRNRTERFFHSSIRQQHLTIERIQEHTNQAASSAEGALGPTARLLQIAWVSAARLIV